MKKTNKLFNLFLLASLALTIIGVIFASLSLFLTYKEDIANIKVASFPAVLFIIFITVSFIIPIIQAIVIKDYKITRAKDDMIFIKVSSIIAILAILALALYDLITLAKGISQTPAVFETWKFFRMLTTLPIALSFVFNLFPNKIRVPSFLRYGCSILTVAFCLFSCLAIYFNPGPGDMPEFFEITFSVAFIFGALFFLYDLKWNVLDSSTRIYIALTSIFASLGFTISFSSSAFILFGNTTSGHTMVNFFEALLLLAFSVYAFSKLIALKRAVGITAKSENQKSDTPPTKNK